MDDQEYIRAAVELAEGFDPVYAAVGDLLCVVVTLTGNDGKFDVNIEDFTGIWLNALAMQLARQVDTTGEYYVVSLPLRAAVLLNDDDSYYYMADALCGNVDEPVASAEGPDRALNIIRAVVDSGVLK